eukprot:RCo050528
MFHPSSSPGNCSTCQQDDLFLAFYINLRDFVLCAFIIWSRLILPLSFRFPVPSTSNVEPLYRIWVATLCHCEKSSDDSQSHFLTVISLFPPSLALVPETRVSLSFLLLYGKVLLGFPILEVFCTRA